MQLGACRWIVWWPHSGFCLWNNGALDSSHLLKPISHRLRRPYSHYFNWYLPVVRYPECVGLAKATLEKNPLHCPVPSVRLCATKSMVRCKFILLLAVSCLYIAAASASASVSANGAGRPSALLYVLLGTRPLYAVFYHFY